MAFNFEKAANETRALLRRQFVFTFEMIEPCRDEAHPTEPWHLAWMLDEIPKLAAQQRFDKAHRWLGYVQGVLAASGIRLEELKRANMPEGAEFNAERI